MTYTFAAAASSCTCLTCIAEPLPAAGVSNDSLTPSQHSTNGSTPVLTAEGWLPKQHRASVGKKTTARPPMHHSSSSFSQFSSAILDEEQLGKLATDEDPQNFLFAQVFDWLQQEQSKRKARKAKSASAPAPDQGPAADIDKPVQRGRSDSQGSEGAFSLGKLEEILFQYASTRREGLPLASVARKRSRRRLKGLRRGSISESDNADVDSVVPSVDATLDNSKTLAYSGGAGEDEADEMSSNSRRVKEHWLTFKSEILRIVHTLRLKGWRRVPLEKSAEIEVTRLSGALTNAVYVVAPPKGFSSKSADASPVLVPRRPPPKLLLRIYGPQVEHLIDRENELQILRRLGKKHIGPRVLGTFNNGRFEEFFHARTLTPVDLRIPETSKQIAKRMRELHEGIELLEEEREGGPSVFNNWDKWVDRCEQVISWLDKEILSPENERKAQYEPWRRRGFVCWVPWPVFRKAVENYRKWLIASCGGSQGVAQQLVFAHNDAQYGNLLRLEPSGESPLMLPANEHKQLVVIDFEYASANTPAQEFANHFTEWCYNYHDPEKPWACNTRAYPTPEEQHRFIRAYVDHRPQVSERSATSPYATPYLNPMSVTTPRLAPFSLDNDVLSSSPGARALGLTEAERLDQESMEIEVQNLMRDTRLWRVANSAMWVAWGIVQAKVPGMEEALAAVSTPQDQNGNGADNNVAASTAEAQKPGNPPVDPEIDESDAFDYLAYSQDRALFFWADVLALGVVKEEELPAEVVEHAKALMINY
ncbi:hypothetical protein DTO212C5_5752 [Paecilomyces variotii]|nr:hypothetical protein DTO212C5_5752 [Paecilomyces variotii]